MPANWEYLLQYHYLTNNPPLKAVTVTLENMAFGGIYDQLGGGFRVIPQMKIGLFPILKNAL
jgi:uncharacterized protein YyaL (SSP411 family)